jgi:hypothetical protein
MGSFGTGNGNLTFKLRMAESFFAFWMLGRTVRKFLFGALQLWTVGQHKSQKLRFKIENLFKVP